MMKSEEWIALIDRTVLHMTPSDRLRLGDALCDGPDFEDPRPVCERLIEEAMEGAPKEHISYVVDFLCDMDAVDRRILGDQLIALSEAEESDADDVRLLIPKFQSNIREQVARAASKVA
jgi:hypothetical protein